MADVILNEGQLHTLALSMNTNICKQPVLVELKCPKVK